MNTILTLALLLGTVPGTVEKVTATPLQKAPFDTKKPLYVTDQGAYTCPDGFEMFIRQVAPKTKDKNVPNGDFESFFYAKTTGDNPPIIVSRPGIQEFIPACLQVSK